MGLYAVSEQNLAHPDSVLSHEITWLELFFIILSESLLSKLSVSTLSKISSMEISRARLTWRKRSHGFCLNVTQSWRCIPRHQIWYTINIEMVGENPKLDRRSKWTGLQIPRFLCDFQKNANSYISLIMNVSSIRYMFASLPLGHKLWFGQMSVNGRN